LYRRDYHASGGSEIDVYLGYPGSEFASNILAVCRLLFWGEAMAARFFIRRGILSAAVAIASPNLLGAYPMPEPLAGLFAGSAQPGRVVA